MKFISYLSLILIHINSLYAIQKDKFILTSGHIIEGAPLKVDHHKNIGTILIDNEIQKIPMILFTKKAQNWFIKRSIDNKGLISNVEEGNKGYRFKVLDSFFSLNQEKSKAEEAIFVYVNPNQEEATKVLSFIKKNRRFSVDASYIEKRIFIPKKNEEYDLLKQVMKAQFPSVIVLHKNKANKIHSSINTVDEIVEIFKDLKEKIKK